MIAIDDRNWPPLRSHLCDCFKSRRRLEAQILVLRHQLNVLQQPAPHRLHVRWADRHEAAARIPHDRRNRPSGPLNAPHFKTTFASSSPPTPATQSVSLGVSRCGPVAPRLVVCGKALSKTGGHADNRPRHDTYDATRWMRNFGAIGRIADGVDEVRRACRQELRQGARFIKIMANGGVSSPTDPIAWQGYSVSEMTAAVEEARDAETYVSAHLYRGEAENPGRASMGSARSRRGRSTN
jgi:hypothetical protein